MNYAIRETIGKWKGIRALAQLAMYESIEELRMKPCGLCVVGDGDCLLCLATDRCSNLLSALGFTLRHPRKGPTILAAIDNILEYLEQLKAR